MEGGGAVDVVVICICSVVVVVDAELPKIRSHVSQDTGQLYGMYSAKTDGLFYSIKWNKTYRVSWTSVVNLNVILFSKHMVFVITEVTIALSYTSPIATQRIQILTHSLGGSGLG